MDKHEYEYFIKIMLHCMYKMLHYYCYCCQALVLPRRQFFYVFFFFGLFVRWILLLGADGAFACRELENIKKKLCERDEKTKNRDTVLSQNEMKMFLNIVVNFIRICLLNHSLPRL